MMFKNFKQRIAVAAGILMLICPQALSAGERPTKTILDNGMTVVIREIPSSPVVSVYALVQTGSATEGKYLGTGISHFLEHMLFKGTHGRGVGEVAARIQAVGGVINAATSKDYTIYTITVPFTHFNVALDILSDMLMNSTIDEQEVERERNVIFGEMRMNRDNPDRRISDLVYQNAYVRHPYRHPIIGYEELLSDVTKDDLTDYYQTFYTPNNTVFSVAGNIDRAGVLTKIKKTFEEFKRGTVVPRNLPLEPIQITSRALVDEYPTELTRLALSFNSTSLMHPDLYPMDVLAMVLGQGRSSRLFVDIYKEKGLVHTIMAYNYTPIDQGLFRVDCLLEQKNVEATIRAVLEQIEEIRQNGISADELEKAKQQVKSNYVFDHQTSGSAAYSQAMDEAFAGDHLFSEKYVDGIAHVTNEDIVRAANTYLLDNRMTTVILKPREEKKENGLSPQKVDERDIVKHELDNGLTVLLKKDDTFPLVSMRITANGGIRQEPAELNGISSIMVAAWIRGTKKMTALDIAEAIESKGMRLSRFSGRNSFGINLEFLSDQVQDAWGLIPQIVHEPVFPREEIEKIKEDLKTTIRQRKDDIFRSTAHELKQTLFLTHPFRLEKEGTVESIDRITRDDVAAFYNKLTVPGNMVISVFGDIDPEAFLSDIKNHFASIKAEPLNLMVHAEEAPKNARKKTRTMDKEQAMVMIGFQGVSLEHEDRFALDILSSILGSSFSGRIFNNIREQLGDAYTLGGNFIPGPDKGFVYFYVLTSESQVNKVEDLLKKEIKALHSAKVPADELEAMKTYLKGTYKKSLETNSSLSMTSALDELYGLGYNNHARYDQDIDQVTADDIKRVARKYLDLNKSAVVITTPEK